MMLTITARPKAGNGVGDLWSLINELGHPIFDLWSLILIFDRGYAPSDAIFVLGLN